MINKQKILPKQVFGALLGVGLLMAVSQVFAVGFGELKVNSYLNQPFDAAVELLSTDDVSNLTVSLAGPTRYKQMNLSPPRNLSTFSASLSLQGGENVVLITSRQPVTDLVVDLVLIMSADGSDSTRHYPVIIDFAPQLDGVVVQPAPAQQSAAPAPVPAPAQNARRVAAVRSGDSYGPVQSGQTLSGIVADIVGDQQVNGFNYMQAIVDLNPQAFAGGDMNRLRAGFNLQLPDIAGFTPLARGAASPTDVQPVSFPTTSATEQPPRDDAQPSQRPIAESNTAEASRLELVGTPTSGEILTSLNRWLEEDDNELGVRSQEARRDLAYATAEIETYRKENDVLKGRVGELEGRINKLRQLIALRAAEDAADAAALNRAATAGPQSAEVLPTDNASAPLTVESELAAATQANPQAESQSAGSSSAGLGWWPWVAGVALLLIVTIWVWYRGRREDQVRAQRTADLVQRIQQAGKRPTDELDLST